MRDRNFYIYFVVQSTFKYSKMDKQQEQLEAIKDIRNMMERSSKFVSLSGMAGVIVGCFVILAVTLLCNQLDISIIHSTYYIEAISKKDVSGHSYLTVLMTYALVMLIVSFLTGMFMAMRRARKLGIPVWDAATKRMFINLMIPLVTGGILCLIMLYHQQIAFMAPLTLIFYGLALVNASKYTIDHIRMLGLMEILLGLIGCLMLDYSLLIWTLGFGVLHIFYGITFYLKFEK